MSAEELSDGEVVREILGGQREMYRVLVRRYQDVLYKHACRMVGQPDDAADIVQRTLVSGFQKLNRCRDPERVGGWLFRIAANLCKDFLKSPRRADLSLEEGSATVIDRSRPDADLEREELKERVQQALERLSPGVLVIRNGGCGSTMTKDATAGFSTTSLRVQGSVTGS